MWSWGPHSRTKILRNAYSHLVEDLWRKRKIYGYSVFPPERLILKSHGLWQYLCYWLASSQSHQKHIGVQLQRASFQKRRKKKPNHFPSMPGASEVTFIHTVFKDRTEDRWGPVEAHDPKQVKWDFSKPCFQDIGSAAWQRLALQNPLSPPSCNYTLYRAHNLQRVLIISKCWGAKSLHSAIKQIPGYR